MCLALLLVVASVSSVNLALTGTMAFHAALCHVERGDLETARRLMLDLARYRAPGRIPDNPADAVALIGDFWE